MYTLTKWVNYIPTKVHTLKLFQASSKIKLCSICKVYPTSCGSICIHHFCQSLLSSFCYKETDLTLMISHVVSISTVNYENNLIDFTQRLIYNYQLYWNLKTIICDEPVCSKETTAPCCPPKHSSPHCVAKWRVSGFNMQANGFENLNCRRGPRSLFACPLHPPHLHSAKHGKGTVFGDQCIVALVSVPQTTIITNVRL